MSSTHFETLNHKNDFRRAIYGINFFNFVLGMFVFGFSLSSLHLEIVPPQFWNELMPLWVLTCAAIGTSISVVVLAFISVSTIAHVESRSRSRIIANFIVLNAVCFCSFCVGLANVAVAPKSFPLLGELKLNFCMNLFFEDSGLVNGTISDKWASYDDNIYGHLSDVSAKIERAKKTCLKEKPLNLMTFCGIILIVISLVLVGHLVVSYKTYKRFVEEEQAPREITITYEANKSNIEISTLNN